VAEAHLQNNGLARKSKYLFNHSFGGGIRKPVKKQIRCIPEVLAANKSTEKDA
jgi:hypothetical protein